MPAEVRQTRQIGEKFESFTVLERIGHGSLQTIHRALKDRELGFSREVALTRMRVEREPQPHILQRVFMKAQLAAQVSHHGIAKVHEFGRSGRTFFLATEYVQGQSLAAVFRMARQPMWPVVAISILYELLEAISYLEGLRERLLVPNLTPENLMLTVYGSLKLIDLGVDLAELASTEPRDSIAEPGDNSYAVGVLAYELLAGRRPRRFRAPGQPPVALPSAVAPSPPELDRWVMRALDSDPNMRYRSARHMQESLLTVCQRLALYPSQKTVEAWVLRQR
jgi:serine/threonine-protein kinase